MQSGEPVPCDPRFRFPACCAGPVDAKQMSRCFRLACRSQRLQAPLSFRVAHLVQQSRMTCADARVAGVGCSCYPLTLVRG